MNSLNFKYKILPYVNSRLENKDGFILPHTDVDQSKELTLFDENSDK